MKLALTLTSVSLLGLFAVGVHAQYGRYGIPTCATPCVEQAAIQGHCGFQDTDCLCKSLSHPDVMATAVRCELKNCPEPQTGGNAGVQSVLVGFYEMHCEG